MEPQAAHGVHATFPAAARRSEPCSAPEPWGNGSCSPRRGERGALAPRPPPAGTVPAAEVPQVQKVTDEATPVRLRLGRPGGARTGPRPEHLVVRRGGAG